MLEGAEYDPLLDEPVFTPLLDELPTLGEAALEEAPDLEYVS